MSFKTSITAVALTAALTMGGAIAASPANAASLGAAGSGSSKKSNSKKKSDKKKSSKKASKKKSKKKASKTSKRNAIVKLAKKQKGKKYRTGGNGPKAFDCSGLVRYVYKKNKIKVPRTSSAIGKAGKRISVKKAKPGDIIHSPGHVGIITKKGKAYGVDAGNSRVGVSERSLSWMKGAKVVRVKALS